MCTDVLHLQTAVRALGLLIQNTGHVITPYLEHPDLISILLTILNRGGGAPWSLRNEVLRTLGILGAVDPNLMNQAHMSVAQRRKGGAGPGGALLAGAVGGAAPAAGSSEGPCCGWDACSLVWGFSRTPAVWQGEAVGGPGLGYSLCVGC